MFKGLSGLGSLIKNVQAIGGQMKNLNEELKGRRATGTAGGGMVEIELNGLMEAVQCRIDPQLSAQNDRELIEDLVVAAVNQAIAKGKQMHTEAVREMTGGLPLPGGLQEALTKFGGTEEGTGEGKDSDDKC